MGSKKLQPGGSTLVSLAQPINNACCAPTLAAHQGLVLAHSGRRCTWRSSRLSALGNLGNYLRHPPESPDFACLAFARLSACNPRVALSAAAPRFMRARAFVMSTTDPPGCDFA